MEGRIIGFDEYMNLVLDDAEELSIKKKTRKPLGRILLKGDNITLLMSTCVPANPRLAAQLPLCRPSILVPADPELCVPTVPRTRSGS